MTIIVPPLPVIPRVGYPLLGHERGIPTSNNGFVTGSIGGINSGLGGLGFAYDDEDLVNVVWTNRFNNPAPATMAPYVNAVGNETGKCNWVGAKSFGFDEGGFPVHVPLNVVAMITRAQLQMMKSEGFTVLEVRTSSQGKLSTLIG